MRFGAREREREGERGRGRGRERLLKSIAGIARGDGDATGYRIKEKRGQDKKREGESTSSIASRV